MERPLQAHEAAIADIQLSEHVLNLLASYGIFVPEDTLPDFEMQLCYDMAKFRGDFRGHRPADPSLINLVERLRDAIAALKGETYHPSHWFGFVSEDNPTLIAAEEKFDKALEASDEASKEADAWLAAQKGKE